MIHKISIITSGLVAILAVGAFVLSYNALYAVGAAAGVSAAWLWPLLIDFAIVVFSLAVLRASLLGEKTTWPWFLVGVFTLATIVFNLIHGGLSLPGPWVSYAVFIIPPVALVLSFETLMGMVKSGVSRGEIAADIAGLVNERDNLQRQVGQLERQAAALEGTIERSTLSFDGLDWGPEQRQAAVMVLSKQGYTVAEQAEALGVSAGTIKNDRKALNGQLQ